MRPLPAHSLAAAVALAFFVFAKSLLMRNARSKTLLFLPPTRSERIRTQSGVIISLLEYLILNHKGIAKSHFLRTLTEARSFGAPVRVRVGRRHLPAGSMEDHGECMLVRWF